MVAGDAVLLTSGKICAFTRRKTTQRGKLVIIQHLFVSPVFIPQGFQQYIHHIFMMSSTVSAWFFEEFFFSSPFCYYPLEEFLKFIALYGSELTKTIESNRIQINSSWRKWNFYYCATEFPFILNTMIIFHGIFMVFFPETYDKF